MATRTLPSVLVAALSLMARDAPAQRRPPTRTLAVTVRDSASHRPVTGARVSLVSRDQLVALTDDAGNATLVSESAAPDTVVVVASGFARYRRNLGRWTEDYLAIEVSLRPAVQQLAGVAVTAAEVPARPTGRLADFERRRDLGKGRYILRDEIERRGNTRTSDLFRGMTGLRVVDSASSRLIISSRSAQASLVSRSANSDCVVPIAVDGVLKEGSFQLDLLSPADIHGIEVYTGIGSIPPEFSSMQRNAWCGLIIVWTRDR